MLARPRFNVGVAAVNRVVVVFIEQVHIIQFRLPCLAL